MNRSAQLRYESFLLSQGILPPLNTIESETTITRDGLVISII